jgi:oligopeptidase B
MNQALALRFPTGVHISELLVMIGTSIMSLNQLSVFAKSHLPRRFLLCIVLLPLAAARGDVIPVQIDPDVAQPPVAKKLPHVVKIHGDAIVDNYFWLRDRTDPDMKTYISQENEYTAAVMKPTEALRDSLYREMLSHFPETDLTVPHRKGDYLYYTRRERGKDYSILCRRHIDPGVPEQVMLDLNELAVGHTFLSVHEHAVSDDGNLLAYSTDITGFRDFTLHFKDLRTGVHLAYEIEKVRTMAWAADNATLFYIVEDAAKRPYRLYRHTVGSGTSVLVHEEADELFRLSVRRSADKEYLFVTSESLTTNETRFIPSRTPTEPPRLILPRRDEIIYDVEHHGGEFLLRTNLDAEDFRLVAAPVADPRPENWREIIPHRPSVVLEKPTDRLAVFARHAVVREREGGLPALRVLDLKNGESHVIKFAETVFSFLPEENPEFDTDLFRFRYTSFVTPETVYDYDMSARKLILRKQAHVLGGYDPANYVVEWIHAKAPDGARVPISLVYRKGVPKDGTAPMVLTGYGAYGSPISVAFDMVQISLLDRGIIYAQAHVRGGGDLGKRWEKQGKLLYRRNMFTDFIAVAEDLIARKYTSSDRLALQSISAGGVLLGGAVNMRPDLFKAVVLQGPFVDVLNTSLDPTLPLTVPEYLEWGDPRNKAEYDIIKSYCPYTNISPCEHPAMLLLSSLEDSQVMYWEPVKYVAKLRAIGTGKKPLLLKVSSGIGHGGPSGLHDRLKEKAFMQSFIISQICANGATARKAE